MTRVSGENPTATGRAGRDQAANEGVGENAELPHFRTCLATYLQTGTSRMALLLLRPVGARSLAAGALAARRLALAASHIVDVGIQTQMQVDARGDRDRA